MDFSLSSSLVGNAVSNPDKLALDLQFAADKTLTARKGPTPVFTRGSGATFVDSDGLVKYGPENLFARSEVFSDSVWIKNGVTVSSASSVNPFGVVTTINKLVSTVSAAERSAFQSTTHLGLLSFSCYMKASEWGFGFFRAFDASGWQNVFFDLVNGTVASTGSGWVNPSITLVGNGWYRCVATKVITTNSIGVIGISNANNIINAAGDGVSGAFVWGAQVERSSTARTYIPTTTAAVYAPRFDHDPITGVCKGLLMEESRTNSALQSNSFSTTPWGENSGTCGLSQNQIGPDGITNSAWTFTDDNAASSEGRYQSISLVSGTPYTMSAYVKKTTGTPSSFPALTFARPAAGSGGVVLDTTTGVVIAVTSYAGFPNIVATVSSVNSGEYWKISATFVLNLTGLWDIALLPAFNTDGTGVQSITATGSAVYYGFQFEAGSFPTSYIPTTTASVIRSADVCSISGSAFSGFYNPLEGTTFISGDKTNSSNTTGAYFSYQSGATEVGPLIFRTATAILGRIRNNSALNLTNTDFSQSPLGEKKLAVAWKATSDSSDRDYCSGGVILTKSNPNTGTSANNQTTMSIGSSPSSSIFNGTISSIRYYRKRLSNAKLQALTA